MEEQEHGIDVTVLPLPLTNEVTPALLVPVDDVHTIHGWVRSSRGCSCNYGSEIPAKMNNFQDCGLWIMVVMQCNKYLL